jgi:hypothetical protein
MSKEIINKVFKNRHNENYVVRKYVGNRYYEIVFDNGETLISRRDHIKEGNVKNFKTRTVFDIGFLGGDTYIPKHNKYIYSKWKDMLRRCYNEKERCKNNSYKDVIVCDEWHNFQNFAEWVYKNYDLDNIQGWQLDKDILVKGNKIYSPDNCCFIPSEINSLLVNSYRNKRELPVGAQKSGNCFLSAFTKNSEMFYVGHFPTKEEAFYAYKYEKEAHIKQIAYKWKGLISHKIFISLYNYEITM